jgi:hypothetical protein
MLKINPDPQFVAEVEITVPGQEETGTITLKFKYMGRKELKKLWDESESDEVLLQGVVLGWEDMDVEFSPENLTIFLDNYPAAAVEIVQAYTRKLFESKVKN